MMPTDQLLDLCGSVVLALGAFFCLAAALGLVRFPDVLSRMHAATKPSVFGLVLVLVGVTLSVRDVAVSCLLVVAVTLQMLTAPVSGHLVARTAYREGEWDADLAIVDELAADQPPTSPEDGEGNVAPVPKTHRPT